MKNVFKLFGITALVAVMTFALAFTACSDSKSSDDNSDNGGNNGGNTGASTFTVTGIPAQYNGKWAFFTNDEETLIGCQSVNLTTGAVTLKQIVNGSVSLPMWTMNASGQVVKYSGNDTVYGDFMISNSATLQSDGSAGNPMIAGVYWDSVTFSNGSATRTWGSGTQFDPSGGNGTPPPNNTGGGTFTVTGIPSQYNGKYGYFEGPNGEGFLVGIQSYNATTDSVTLVQIANGNVSLPMWTDNTSGQIEKYSGNDTCQSFFAVFNIATLIHETDNVPLALVTWDSITFSNGSATKAWSSGTLQSLD